MPEGEARVLHQSHGIQEPELLSGGDVWGAFDSSTTMSESIILDVPTYIVRTRVGMDSSLPTGPRRQISGFRFLCFCPRVVPFRTNGIADGRFAREGICLQMADFPELY